MLKQANSPDGYKHLLVYRKAEELVTETLRYTATFPKDKTGVGLADQMDRSVRSVKANIVEGWKRNATHEYYTFLGYAAASNEELMEDYRDICLCRYEEKGIKGGKGRNGEQIMKQELESLRFYPLDTHLPLCIQLYLRTKEIRMLLDKLQSSLQTRMEEKKTLSERDRIRLNAEWKHKKEQEIEAWTKGEWARLGIVMTGQGVKKKEEAERLGLSWWHYGEPER